MLSQDLRWESQILGTPCNKDIIFGKAHSKETSKEVKDLCYILVVSTSTRVFSMRGLSRVFGHVGLVVNNLTHSIQIRFGGATKLQLQTMTTTSNQAESLQAFICAVCTIIQWI